MQTEIKDLVKQSVIEGQTPRQLIANFKKAGFKKNTRGNPWRESYAKMQQYHMRKELRETQKKKAPRALALTTSLNRVIEQIEAFVEEYVIN